MLAGQAKRQCRSEGNAPVDRKLLDLEAGVLSYRRGLGIKVVFLRACSDFSMEILVRWDILIVFHFRRIEFE